MKLNEILKDVEKASTRLSEIQGNIHIKITKSNYPDSSDDCGEIYLHSKGKITISRFQHTQVELSDEKVKEIVEKLSYYLEIVGESDVKMDPFEDGIL